MSAKHTPTPWKIARGPNGFYCDHTTPDPERSYEVVFVAPDMRQCDADFLTNAVNCHDELVELLGALIDNTEMDATNRDLKLRALAMLTKAE
jgi:hypothetical protein